MDGVIAQFPPLKPIPMVFFLLVYSSSAMLCENDGDGGGRGGGVSIGFIYKFFFFLFKIVRT